MSNQTIENGRVWLLFSVFYNHNCLGKQPNSRKHRVLVAFSFLPMIDLDEKSNRRSEIVLFWWISPLIPTEIVIFTGKMCQKEPSPLTPQCKEK